MKHDRAIAFAEHHACELHTAGHAVARMLELRLEVVTDEGLSFSTPRMVPRIGETGEALEQDLELEQSLFFLLIGKLCVPSISSFVQLTLQTS